MGFDLKWAAVDQGQVNPNVTFALLVLGPTQYGQLLLKSEGPNVSTTKAEDLSTWVSP